MTDHNKENGSQPVIQEPIQLQFGDEKITISPLGWRYARKWTTSLLNTVKPYVSLLASWQDIKDISLDSEDGQARLVEIATLLLDKAPEEVFELVASHQSLVKYRNQLEEHATTLQIASAFAKMLEFEFPLEQLVLIFGPLVPKTSKKPPTAYGASTVVPIITKMP